jgi:hypothetical protein
MRDAKEILDALGMQPHPEGGWYVEIHRSRQRVEPVTHGSEASAERGPIPNLMPQRGDAPNRGADAPVPGSRAAMTSIYYLLESGQRSHWHRVDADELWAWHAGAPMELSIAVATDPDSGQALRARAPHGDERTVNVHRLGMSLADGERPQAVVPAHAWQSARPLGAWSLIGCVVAPGFEFAHFEIAPPGWSP